VVEFSFMFSLRLLYCIKIHSLLFSFRLFLSITVVTVLDLIMRLRISIAFIRRQKVCVFVYYKILYDVQRN
jgi:hypothetical protein